MGLKKILRKNLTYCFPSSSVVEVAEAMSLENVGAVVVVDAGGMPVGILTDRDLVIRCVAARRDPAKVTAESVMSREVESVCWDQSVAAVARRMQEARVRRVVIVDEGGSAIGLLSFDDIFELLTEELAQLRTAVVPRESKLVRFAA